MSDVDSAAPARGLVQLGRSVEDTATASGKIFATVGANFVQRQNEREYTQVQSEYWKFENDLLRGENGILRLPADRAEGSTLSGVEKLQEYANEYFKNSTNPVVRDEAFRFFTREIARTRDVLSANEAAKLQALGVSSAAGALMEGLRKARTLEPNRFLPVTIEGSEVYADPVLIAEIESGLKMMHAAEDWSDVQVSEEARATISEHAAQAAIYQLDQGPNHFAAAQRIYDAYEDEWDSETRAAVKRRLDVEVEFGLIDPSVASAVDSIASSGGTLTGLNISRVAVTNYKAMYRKVYGQDPSDAAVQEVKRRAIAEASLRDDHRTRVTNERRGADLVRLIQASQQDSASAEIMGRELLKTAHGEDDLAFARSVETILDNLNKSKNRSPHPTQTTPSGFLALRNLDDMTESEMMNLIPEVSASDFEKYVGPRLGLKSTVPPQADLDEALDKARYRIQGKGPYEKTDANVDHDYFIRYRELQAVAERFYRDNDGRLPSRAELDEMAESVHLSLDSPGPDVWSTSGTISNVLSGDAQLDTSDASERAILQTLIETSRVGENLVMQRALVNAFGTTLVSPEDLSKRPEVAAELLRLAIATNPRLLRDDSVRFREELRAITIENVGNR